MSPDRLREDIACTCPTVSYTSKMSLSNERKKEGNAGRKKVREKH